ncbi:hypothetical protein [Enterococcus sp. HY326]|uniref:hypothetical protein n=1 Tax=Enterococcus sp. HY326 TaxID=2971265 RepID=UPI00223EB5B6|nr:hypothetical protein [Enterococcus sp. HY326]
MILTNEIIQDTMKQGYQEEIRGLILKAAAETKHHIKISAIGFDADFEDELMDAGVEVKRIDDDVLLEWEYENY